MELVDTIELMRSENFIDRFKAEYYQTKIRHDKLHVMTVKLEAGTLDFTPACGLDIFKNQLWQMEQYLYSLELRAEIEGIDLTMTTAEE